jgi:hypothetical protein
MINMKILFIISKIAIICNKNPYESISEIFIKYLEKYYCESYSKAINSFKTGDKEKIIENNKTKLEIGKELCKKNNINIENVKNANNLDELNSKKTNIKSEIQKSEIGEKEKMMMESYLNHNGNTNFGIKNENNVVRKLEDDSGKIYKTGLGFIKKVVENIKSNKGGLEIEIGGKADGIDGNILIEIKNRVYKFFDKLREYEKVQVQCYLELYNLEICELVECLEKGGKRDLRKHEINRDREYFKLEILSYLVGFSKLLRDIGCDINLMRDFLMMEREERDKFLVSSIGNYREKWLKRNM